MDKTTAEGKTAENAQPEVSGDFLPSFALELTDEEIDQFVTPSGKKLGDATPSTTEKDTSEADNDITTDVPQGKEVEVSPASDGTPETTVKPEDKKDDSDEDKVEISDKEFSQNSSKEAIAYFNTLVEKGRLEDQEDFDGTWEDLQRVIDQQEQGKDIERIQVAAEALVSQAPSVVQQLLELAFTKKDLTHDDLKAFFEKTQPMNFDEVKLTDADSAREWLSKQMVANGQDEDDVEILLDSWEEKGVIVKKAEGYLAEIKQKSTEVGTSEISEIKETEEQQRAALMSLVSNTQETINKQKWAKTRKQIVTNEVYSLLQGKSTDKLKSIINSPKGLMQYSDFLSYWDSDKGEFNLSKYEKQAFSASTQSVKSTIEKHMSELPNSAKSNQVMESLHNTKIDPKDIGEEVEIVL